MKKMIIPLSLLLILSISSCNLMGSNDDWNYNSSSPEILSFSADRTSIDTSSSDEIITLFLEVTDEDGIEEAYIYLKSPSGDTQVGLGCILPSDLYSGTYDKGTFSIPVTFPQYSEAGIWTVCYIEVWDLNGNTLTYTNDDWNDPVPAEYELTIENTASIYDSSAPSITEITQDKTSIDTSASDQTITFTMTAVDDMELNRAYISVESPSGEQYQYDYCYEGGSGYTGTLISGTYSLEIVIPRYSEIGTWKVTEISLTDHLNRVQELKLENGTLSSAGYDFQIVNTASVSDTEAPSISNVTIDQTVIDTSASGQTVTFNITTSDNYGLKYAYIYIYSPSGNEYQYDFTFVDSDFSGSQTNGIFTMRVTFPQNSEAGVWYISSIGVSDNFYQQIDLYYSDGSLASAGFDYTLTVSN